MCQGQSNTAIHIIENSWFRSHKVGRTILHPIIVSFELFIPSKNLIQFLNFLGGYIQLIIVNAADAFKEISEFYETCHRKTTIVNDEIFILAKKDNHILGAVRLCFENGTYLLRTMQVREDLQGKGIGRIILKEFEKLIQQMKIEIIYCMPYDHLENFYGLIGFKKISLQKSPGFLIERVNDFHKRHSDQKVIVMHKINTIL